MFNWCFEENLSGFIDEYVFEEEDWANAELQEAVELLGERLRRGFKSKDIEAVGAVLNEYADVEEKQQAVKALKSVTKENAVQIAAYLGFIYGTLNAENVRRPFYKERQHYSADEM